MKNILSLVLVLILSVFAVSDLIAQPQEPPQPGQSFSCQKTGSAAVKTKKQYSDDYGTTITSDAAMLTTPVRNYRWGIKNVSTLTMAYYTFYLKPEGRYGFFRTSIYIDSGIKAPMTFFIRNGDRNGEVLKSVTVYPGQTVDVEIEIARAKKLHVFSELKINHDKAEKIIFGEPEFFNCRK